MHAQSVRSASTLTHNTLRMCWLLGSPRTRLELPSRAGNQQVAQSGRATRSGSCLPPQQLCVNQKLQCRRYHQPGPQQQPPRRADDGCPTKTKTCSRGNRSIDPYSSTTRSNGLPGRPLVHAPSIGARRKRSKSENVLELVRKACRQRRPPTHSQPCADEPRTPRSTPHALWHAIASRHALTQ